MPDYSEDGGGEVGEVGGGGEDSRRVPMCVLPKPETRNPKSETRNPEPQTPNPKPETPNPKPGTRNPKPETQDQKPETVGFLLFLLDYSRYIHQARPFVGVFQKSISQDFSGNLGQKLTNGSKNNSLFPKRSLGYPIERTLFKLSGQGP